MDYDTLIRDGLVFDGSGADGIVVDVAVRDGRVVALGESLCDATAELVIDAHGKVVAPGFVDVHTHYDAQILWDPLLSVSPWHGVTTVVMGNCGLGLAPNRDADRLTILQSLEKIESMNLEALREGLGTDWGFHSFAEYLDTLERRGVGVNVGVLFPHNALRQFVMGAEASSRVANASELEQMAGLLREGLAAGAMGFSTSRAITHVGHDGQPIPSRVASLDEIKTLARELGVAGHGVFMASAGPGLFIREFADIARETGRPVTWAALLTGLNGPGSHRDMQKRTADLARQGLRVAPQISCRPLQFEYSFADPYQFGPLPIFKEISLATDAQKMHHYADPAFREAFRAFLTPALQGWPERTVIGLCPGDPSLEERRLVDVALERGVDPVDLALDLSIHTQLRARFRTAFLNSDEIEVAELLRDPNVVCTLSDGGAHAAQICDTCYPTYLLGHWVREKGVLTLPEAIKMLTSMPAALFGLKERGSLRVGGVADLVVFDPRTVAAGPLHRVHDLPSGADRLVSEPRGIDVVMVNGTIIRHGNRNAVSTGKRLPGQLLRSRA